MLDNNAKSLAEVEGADLDWPWGPEGAPAVRRHVGSGSGGYADLIFLHAAEQLFGETNAQLTYKNLRSVSYRALLELE